MAQQQNRQTTHAAIVSKALQDDAFRSALQSDPKGTIAKEFGVSLPSDLQIEVLQETPTQAYVVLPPGGGEELSEDELAGTSQASDCWLVCTSCSEWTSFEPGESSAC